jgi:hypothetical protein
VKTLWITAACLFLVANRALAVGGIADVTIYDRADQRVLPLYYHDGRYYVVGKPGNEYQVNIRNQQPGEILAVVSVDGVNAVSGETAEWSQTGYVLSPYTSFDIPGWRKSLRHVAAFFFTEIDNSYAARTERPDNVGVIGVAVFRKKPVPAAVRPLYREDAASVRHDAPAAGAVAGMVDPSRTNEAVPLAEKSLGTGHGKSETSVVRYTDFERASATPDEVIAIYYDSYRNLVAQGVIRDTPRVALPNPFPHQFVPDPR